MLPQITMNNSASDESWTVIIEGLPWLTHFFLHFFKFYFFFKYYLLSSLTVDYLFYILTFLLLSFRNIIKYKKIFWARYNIIQWNLIFQYANSLLLNDLDWLCVTLSKVVAFLLICKLLFHIKFINQCVSKYLPF